MLRLNTEYARSKLKLIVNCIGHLKVAKKQSAHLFSIHFLCRNNDGIGFD